MTELQLFDGAFQCSSICSQPMTLPLNWDDPECIAWAKEHEYSYVLLENEMGYITHYLKPNDIGEGRQSIHPGYLLSHSSSLFEAFESIQENGFVLLLEGKRTNGIITWQDINKPPFMAWIFSQFSLMETGLKERLRMFLASHQKANGKADQVPSLLHVLAESRLEKALIRFTELKKEQAEIDMIDALDLTDVLDVVLKYKTLREYTFKDLSSKDRKKIIGRIARFRNAAAHSRSLVTCIEDCKKLFVRLSIVRGVIESVKQLEEMSEAYETTLYRTFEGDEFRFSETPIWSGTENRNAAFITAHNPWSVPLDESVNLKNHQALIENCQELGLDFKEGEGVDLDGVWPAERSVLILGTDFTRAYEIARKFGQLAFVWIEDQNVELHWVL